MIPQPAFPGFDAPPYGSYRGMTLRDYFAAAALQGFVMAHTIANGPLWSVEQIATNSYGVADAMLVERARRSDE